MIRSLGGLVVTLSLLAMSAPARADDAEAAAHVTQATSLYDDEKFEGALIEFETAYQLSHDYKLLYNIAICHTLLNDLAAAQLTFQRYLALGKTDIDDQRRAEIQDRLASLVRSTSPVTITTNAPPGSQVTIDDLSIGYTPLPDTVPVKVGHRVFAITSNGRTSSRAINVVAGQNLRVNLDFTSTDRVALRDPDAPIVKGPTFPIAWWGLTAGLGVAAIATGSVALVQRDNLERARARFGVSKSTLVDDRDGARAFGIVTDSLLVVTVAGAALSTYFTLDYLSKKKRQSTGFYITPFGAGYARTF